MLLYFKNLKSKSCMYWCTQLYTALAFQMCTRCLPVLLKTIPGYLVNEGSEVEPLMFIHHLYFSESQFGPFPSYSAPKWSSFKIKRKGRMWRKLGGGCGRGLGNGKPNFQPPLYIWATSLLAGAAFPALFFSRSVSEGWIFSPQG